MPLLAMKRDGVTLHVFGSAHPTERQPQVFEYRPLFDVQFEIGGGILLLAPSFRESIDPHATAAQGIFHADAVFVRTRAIHLDGMGASESRGSQQAAAETGSFFVSKIHQADSDGRTAFELFNDS